LTGPGGIGKTRLAQDVAASLVTNFADGVVWVPLAPITQAEFVGSAIAQACGIRESGEQVLIDAVRAALREACLLLVLDNFEHVLGAATLVAELLTACPRITVLVTSRALLRISGEHAYPVPPLALPDTNADVEPDELAQSAAVQLFVDRAQSVVPSFALTATNGPVVVAICRRLEGLPLAIELAAARTNLMPATTLLTRLDRRLPLLTGGARDQPERLRTMRAAIAWSYDLLSSDEQIVFRRLGVFVGGASLDAAVAVCSAFGDAPDPIAAITTLVDWSLVQATEAPPGHARFEMLETIREFALERLQAAEDEATVRHAHAEYFLDLVRRLNILVELRDQAAALAILEVEHANLRVAVAWLWEQRDSNALDFCRFCEDAYAFWWARGHIEEGLGWIDQALTLTVPLDLRSSVLRAAAWFRLARGELDLASSLAREAAEIASSVECHWVEASALLVLGWSAAVNGNTAGEMACYEQGLAAARKMAPPRPFQENTLLQCMATVALREGDLKRAEALAKEALAVLAPFHERYGVGFVLRTLGWTYYRKGNLANALKAWGEAFQASREVDDPWQMADSLGAFGRAALDVGEVSLAARWLGTAEVFRERSGRTLLENYDLFHQTIELTRSRLGPERFKAAWGSGRRRSPNDVWDEIQSAALDQRKSAPAGSPVSEVSSTAPRMTPREHEILDLLVAGMPDREISEALFISVRTVEGHVARVLAKLGAPNRTAATRAAIAAGLVPAASLDQSPH
jgi:predicted ATPase/DNA-binding CsgD family transcriptional regulator